MAEAAPFIPGRGSRRSPTAGEPKEVVDASHEPLDQAFHPPTREAKAI